MDSNTALAELKNFQSTRKGAGDYSTQFQKELGVDTSKTRADDMRGLIRNTETALKGVGESVAGRTRGALVTEAQRSRLENLERAPISEELGSLQGGYNDEMTNYRDLMGQAGQKASMAYQTDADRMAALEGNYNKLFQSEQAAEARRQYEESLRFQREQAAAQERASRAAASAAAASLGRASTGSGAAGGKKTFVGSDDFRGRLAYLAQNGSGDARVALNYAGNDGRYDGPVTSADEFAALKRAGIAGNFYIRGTSNGAGSNSGVAGLSSNTNLSNFRFK